MQTIPEKKIKHDIFNYLPVNNLIVLRAVNKAFSILIWDLLNKTNDPGAITWQLAYLAEQLTHSDALFKQNEDAIIPPSLHAMKCLYGSLFNSRKQHKKIYLSDLDMKVLLKRMMQKNGINTISLLESIAWTLSPKHQDLVQNTIQNRLQTFIERLQKENYTEQTLENIIYLKKYLKNTQLFAVASMISHSSMAEKLVYKERVIFALFNEMKTRDLDKLINNMLPFSEYKSDEIRLNMLVIFSCYLRKKDRVSFKFIMEKIRFCLTSNNKKTCLKALKVLHDYAPLMQDKTPLLKEIQPFLQNKDQEIRNFCIKILMNHQPGFHYDEVILYWRKTFMHDGELVKLFLHKLTATEQEEFTSIFLKSFIEDVSNANFSPLNLILLEHLSWNNQQWQRILALIFQGLKNENNDQKIQVIYMIKSLAGRLDEQEIDRFSKDILLLIENGNQEFMHPLLILLEQIPALLTCNKKKVLDFTFQAMYSNAHTRDLALETLKSFCIQDFSTQEIQEILRQIKIWLLTDPEQVLSVYVIYLPYLEEHARNTCIASLLKILQEEEKSLDSLKNLNILRKILDPVHRKTALSLIQVHLHSKASHDIKKYALEMFFDCVNEYKQEECLETVDIQDVILSLQLLLNHEKKEYRHFAMEKMIIFLKSTLFSDNIRQLGVINFFGKTNNYVESICINLIAQTCFPNIEILFQACSNHFLQSNVSPKKGMIPTFFKTVPSSEAREYTNRACNLLYQILHHIDPENHNPQARINFIEQVKTYPVFMPVIKSLQTVQQHIKMNEIELWNFEWMEPTMNQDENSLEM